MFNALLIVKNNLVCLIFKGKTVVQLNCPFKSFYNPRPVYEVQGKFGNRKKFELRFLIDLRVLWFQEDGKVIFYTMSARLNINTIADKKLRSKHSKGFLIHISFVI